MRQRTVANLSSNIFANVVSSKTSVSLILTNNSLSNAIRLVTVFAILSLTFNSSSFVCYAEDFSAADTFSISKGVNIDFESSLRHSRRASADLRLRFFSFKSCLYFTLSKSFIPCSILVSAERVQTTNSKAG